MYTCNPSFQRQNKFKVSLNYIAAPRPARVP